MVDISGRVRTGRLGSLTIRSTALPIALAVIFAAGYAVQAATYLNHDVAFQLYSAGRILEGSRLYQDILDVNPPLVWFQALPSVAIGGAIGVSEITVYRLYILALIALTIFLANIVLKPLLDDEPDRMRPLLLLGLAALLILWFWHFGQREHVTTILVMPYILATAVAARGRHLAMPTALIVGLCAGIGVSMKPYFLLLPALLELYVMVERRRWTSWIRPDALALAAIGGAYAASIALFTPEYVTWMVPIALDVYWAFESTQSRVIYSLVAITACPLSVILLVSLGGCRRIPQMQWTFGLAAAALAVAAVLQNKGWSYHFFPVFVLLAAWAQFMVLAAVLKSRHPRPWSGRYHAGIWIICGALVMLAPVISTWNLYKVAKPGMGRDTAMIVDDWVALIDEHASGDSVFAFSSSIMPAFPAINYSRTDWASRSGHLWMLPAVARARAAGPDSSVPLSGPALDEIEAMQREAVIEDLTRWRPALIFVDVNPGKQGFGGLSFDYLAYFMADPRFVSLWADYEELTTIHGHQVFRRRGPV